MISYRPPTTNLSAVARRAKEDYRLNSRDDWIRTSDLVVPNDARYRAALHPVMLSINDRALHDHLYISQVGMTGFEPATPRPPDVYSNRAELHPEWWKLQIRNPKFQIRACFRLRNRILEFGICPFGISPLVGHTGFEPVTSCLSSMRSKPTELMPLK